VRGARLRAVEIVERMKTSWMVLGLAVVVATAAWGYETSGSGGRGCSGSVGDDG
jgi:hypothetical protein